MKGLISAFVVAVTLSGGSVRRGVDTQPAGVVARDQSYEPVDGAKQICTRRRVSMYAWARIRGQSRRPSAR